MPTQFQMKPLGWLDVLWYQLTAHSEIGSKLAGFPGQLATSYNMAEVPHQCWKGPWGFSTKANLAQRGQESSKVTRQSDAGQAFQAYSLSLHGHIWYP